MKNVRNGGAKKTNSSAKVQQKPSIVVAKNGKSARIFYFVKGKETKTKRFYDWILLYGYVDTLKQKSYITSLDASILKEESMSLKQTLRPSQDSRMSVDFQTEGVSRIKDSMQSLGLIGGLEEKKVNVGA